MTISPNSKTRLLIYNVYVDWDGVNYKVYCHDLGLFDAVATYLFHEGFLDNLPEDTNVLMYE